MENTILISDRLFLFASAFFRVNNTEWVNAHELIYEDNEEEIVNRFHLKMGKLIQRILVLLSRIFKLIQFGMDTIFNKDICPKDDSFLSQEHISLFHEKSAGEVRNYNGFYSRRNVNNIPQTPDNKSIWSKIRKLLHFSHSQKINKNPREIHRSGRMYRGNSLE